MAATAPILVAFATANTGSKVVEQLSAAGHAVRALVRNPDKPEAKALAALPHVEVVKGDIDSGEGIKEALAGVKRAFLTTGAGEHTQYDREVAFLQATQEAGLELVVRISTHNILIDPDTICVYGRAHARIEQWIAEHKPAVIDLRPNFFLSNWLSSAAEIKATGKMTYPVTPDNTAKAAFVDTRDVAGAAVALLLLPSDKLGPYKAAGAFEVHGPQKLTFTEALKELGEVIGKPVELNYLDPEAWSKVLQGFGMSELFANSFTDTVLKVAGARPSHRECTQDNSALLLEVWQPKYTARQWAADHAAAFK